MAITLNRELVQQLITQKYGSVDELVVEWEERAKANKKSKRRARDRSTIYKWLNSGLPTNQDVVFEFSGLLDVDPIAIIDTSKKFIDENFARERHSFQFLQRKNTILASFRAMFIPGWRWPDDKLAKRHYGRPWYTTDYLYDLGDIQNVYAAFSITINDTELEQIPRVYYIAYKQKKAVDKLWRPYGLIIVHNGRTRLISESGDWQEVDNPSSHNNAILETFFGPRATYFRIGSLHPFDLTVTTPSKETDAVRFF